MDMNKSIFECGETISNPDHTRALFLFFENKVHGFYDFTSTCFTTLYYLCRCTRSVIFLSFNAFKHLFADHTPNLQNLTK